VYEVSISGKSGNLDLRCRRRAAAAPAGLDELAGGIHVGQQIASEMLEALEALLPFLPDENDICNAAARHGGRLPKFDVAAQKIRAVHAKLQSLNLGNGVECREANTQSGPDFYQVFGFATATARPAALNPVPELPIEQEDGQTSARAGSKKPGPIVARALSAGH